MRLAIDLMKFIGAEAIERNHVPGVFIPVVPNAHVVYDKKGLGVFVSIFVFAIKSLKPYNYRGKIQIPEEHKDRYLSTDTLLKKGRFVAWGWADRKKGSAPGSSLVTAEDFKSLVGD